MELEATLDSITLAQLVKQEFGLNNVTSLFWTDSIIILYSLDANTKHFPLFPCKKIQRSLKLSKIYDLNYVPLKHKLADFAFWGVTS